MSAAFHPCAADHCDVQIPNRKLMCSDDWALVLRAVQSQVNSAYRNRSRTGWGPYVEAITAAREAVARALGGREICDDA